MKTVKNLFLEIVSFENLFKAWENARKGKKYRNDVMEYSDKLEENIINTQNHLIHNTYKVGRYSSFYIIVPKKRLIMSLQFKDRVIQWAFYQVLNPIFDKSFIHDSYACRKGKGTHKAADRLQYWLRHTERKAEQYYYLKLDISKFFYRIDHEVLLKILKNKIKDTDVIRTLNTIINSEESKFGLPSGMEVDEVPFEQRLDNVGVPIGNLTSQMFANIYMNELDQFAKHKLKLKYYIRYMDDIIILHKDKKYLADIKEEIEEFLNDYLKLHLNNKTCIRPTSMGIEFVGFRIWSTHKKLRKETTKRMKSRLKYLFEAYKHEEITKESLDRSIASYKGIMNHFDSYGLRKYINELYKNIKRD